MRLRLNQQNFWLAVLAGLMLMTTNLFAQPPGKGGGGGGGSGDTPSGTIYFRHAHMMWQMDANGTPSSRIALPAAPDYGHPSNLRHNGKRWFAYDQGWNPYSYLQFPNGRDFTEIRIGSEAGEDVLVLSDTNLEIIGGSLHGPLWSKDDSSITFVAERWGLDAQSQPYAFDAGIYRLPISFVAGMPVAGTLEFVQDLSLELRATDNGVLGYGRFEFCGHSWNHDETQCAFGARFDINQTYSQEIWIVDTVTGVSQLFVSGDGVGWPEWSPDGKYIGYTSSAGAVIYDLTKKTSKRLSRKPREGWGVFTWSPSSAFVVIPHWDNFLNGYDAIYRFTSALGGKTSLTQGMDTPQNNTFIPVGWRD